MEPALRSWQLWRAFDERGGFVSQNAITVSQLNRYIKAVLSEDVHLKSICLKGEISNFTDHKKTGHFYFTLKDTTSAVRAVMFRGYASKVRFTPENGMNVIVTGSVQVFERDGAYQIYCETMEPDGIGALYLAFEQLKEKLAREGGLGDDVSADETDESASGDDGDLN